MTLTILATLLLFNSGCQRAISPQQVTLKQWTADFPAGNATDVQVRDDGTITFSIEEDSGGPEYLWFDLKVVAHSDQPIWFQIENALGAHQTDQRWNISKPFFSTDGKTWIRCVDTRFGKEGIAKQMGEPVFRFRSPLLADTLYAAYFQPYGLSELGQFLQTLTGKEGVKVSSLGQSEEKRDIPLITFDALDGSEDHQTIWIIAREHPGEAPSTFVCQGMVEALLSNEYAGLRHSYKFKIVPIFNVDGVEAGYYYHNATGVNLARDWIDFKAAETTALRQAIEEDTTNGHLSMIFNLHSSNDPSKGHFFLKVPSKLLSEADKARQDAFFQHAGRLDNQIQGHSPVTLKDIPGIMGNVLYKQYGIYVLYLESNYSRGADGSEVTNQSLKDAGRALVESLKLISSGEQP